MVALPTRKCLHSSYLDSSMSFTADLQESLTVAVKHLFLSHSVCNFIESVREQTRMSAFISTVKLNIVTLWPLESIYVIKYGHTLL